MTRYLQFSARDRCACMMHAGCKGALAIWWSSVGRRENHMAHLRGVMPRRTGENSQHVWAPAAVCSIAEWPVRGRQARAVTGRTETWTGVDLAETSAGSVHHEADGDVQESHPEPARGKLV